MTSNTIFLCGIGGSGMSALAQVLAARGYNVRGSDRAYDNGRNLPLFESLEKLGIALYPQDGSGLDASVARLVVSTAVEDTIPDVAAARKHNVPIVHRAQMLADIFASFTSRIAVGGTSGKTTTTGMIGHILGYAGYDPCVVNGGRLQNAQTDPLLSNVRLGKGDICVIEADESDGSIERYAPTVSVVTNITLDHKPLPELQGLFEGFVARTTGLSVINADCKNSTVLVGKTANQCTFAHTGQADYMATGLVFSGLSVGFDVGRQHFEMPVAGAHNVANALAAIAVCVHVGVSLADCAKALESFKGMARRLDLVGEKAGIRVIDDFAHNPDKIAASLSALKQTGARLHVLFQPHGFGPTRMMRAGLVESFAGHLGENDVLYFPDIYYAGGTAQKDISSADLKADLEKQDVPFVCVYQPSRDALVEHMAKNANTGDICVIMGARDDGLTILARKCLQLLG